MYLYIHTIGSIGTYSIYTTEAQSHRRYMISVRFDNVVGLPVNTSNRDESTVQLPVPNTYALEQIQNRDPDKRTIASGLA